MLSKIVDEMQILGAVCFIGFVGLALAGFHKEALWCMTAGWFLLAPRHVLRRFSTVRQPKEQTNEQ